MKIIFITIIAGLLLISCDMKFESEYEKFKSRMEEYADWRVRSAHNAVYGESEPNFYEMRKVDYMSDSIEYSIMKDFYDEMCVKGNMKDADFVEKLFEKSETNSEEMKENVGSKIDQLNDILIAGTKFLTEMIKIWGVYEKHNRESRMVERDFDFSKWQMDFLEKGMDEYLKTHANKSSQLFNN